MTKSVFSICLSCLNFHYHFVTWFTLFRYYFELGSSVVFICYIPFTLHNLFFVCSKTAGLCEILINYYYFTVKHRFLFALRITQRVSWVDYGCQGKIFLAGNSRERLKSL